MGSRRYLLLFFRSKERNGGRPWGLGLAVAFPDSPHFVLIKAPSLPRRTGAARALHERDGPSGTAIVGEFKDQIDRCPTREERRR